MVSRVIMSCLLSIALVSALQQKWLCRAGAPPEWQRFCQFSVEGKGQIPRSPRIVVSFYALSESGQSRQGEVCGAGKCLNGPKKQTARNRRMNYEDTIYHSARCHLHCVHGLSVPERNHSRNLAKRPTHLAKPTLRTRNERCPCDLRPLFVRRQSHRWLQPLRDR